MKSKIFVSHSINFDYQNDLYSPLIDSKLNEVYKIWLPHNNKSVISTKERIRDSNLILSEVSFPATGQGIELGWADNYKIPIICIYKKGHNPANSLKLITDIFIEYDNPVDMINKIKSFLDSFKK